MVHRDLKPANIKATDEGDFKILDLGLATEFRRQANWSFCGTPAYASPEQASGLPADGRADQYALALIAWELLAGRRPFVAHGVGELLEMHRSHELPPLSELVSGVPKSVETALRRALSKEPDARYPTCKQFAVALGCQFLSGQAPSTEVLLEADAGVECTWRESFQFRMGGRRAVHLVLGRDSLWCFRGVVVDRTPLRLIDDVRPSLDGRRLHIRTAEPGGFVSWSFNFRSRKECRIWHEGLRSGRDRERAAPSGDPELEKVSTGPVVLVQRQPTQRYQLLGQVEAHDRRKKSARAGMITRARMMGADAVVDLEEERVPGPRRTLWRSTGSAIRAVDSEGRWQLKARWFGSQVRRWTTFCLAYILGEFLFICLFYSSDIGKEMNDGFFGTHLPVTTLIAGSGLMRLIPFLLCVALHRLQWGQLVRPAAAVRHHPRHRAGRHQRHSSSPSRSGRDSAKPP